MGGCHGQLFCLGCVRASALDRAWLLGRGTDHPSSAHRQVDLSTKNVFGQPRLRASLRDLRSPRKAYKSTIEDDLKKLIIMDSTGLEQEDELVRLPTASPPPRERGACWRAAFLEPAS